MMELAFPTFGAITLYLVAVPVLSVAAHLALRLYRGRVEHGHEMGTAGVWLAIVTPVVLPLAWLCASVWHRLDGHHDLVQCLVPHSFTEVCLDLVLLAAFGLAPLKVAGLRRWWRSPRRGPRLTPASHAGIRYFAGARVPGLVCARGYLRPRIEVDEVAVGLLDERQLAAVLLHEQQHVASRDPLLRWFAHLCLAVNPARRLLVGFQSSWELGREMRSDLRAVQRGADRFALAQALVRVVRAQRGEALPVNCCGLATPSSLELRVRMLCADAAPEPRTDWPAYLAVAPMAVLVSRHWGDHSMFDWLHRAAELAWAGIVGV